MRILVVSNFYPPHHIGGYELGCRDAVEGLKARGHEVVVLTSTYGLENAQHADGVYRWLEDDYVWRNKHQFSYRYLFKLYKKEIINRKAFKRLCEEFKPDVIYVWNLWYTSLSIVFAAEQMKLPISYYIFDYWLALWNNDPAYFYWNFRPRNLYRRCGWATARLLLSGLGSLTYSKELSFNNLQFGSQYLKCYTLRSGKPVGQGKVIHWGVDPSKFPYREVSAKACKKLLYVGQVVPHKGVHTSVEALRILNEQYGYDSVSLTIVGGTTVPDYEAHIRRLVSSAGLEDKVYFAGMVSRDDLPSVYPEYDALVFPSVWEEPFGITLLEGMSSGLAVVSTANGGSAEIVQHESNALVFSSEDAETCAAHIARLFEDRDYFEHIRKEGRQTVEQKFTFERTITMIEHALREAVAAER